MSDPVAMRTCARCQVAKPVVEFALKSAARGTYRSYCRPCCSDYGKEHYRKNIASYLSRSKMRGPIDRLRNRRFVAAYLAAHPCVDCGEADPIVLEFDHRDPTTKRSDVGRLIHTSTVGIVRAEIEKCDVRCGNCHRIRTATQFGWYRLGEALGAYLI
ncbi:MAG TPA: hypothetical protein VGT60_05730 [Candidatus Limnocylindria bacterium]|nr:hypothetical protein [Candidatus Limnocylindria bacterium]